MSGNRTTTNTHHITLHCVKHPPGRGDNFIRQIAIHMGWSEPEIGGHRQQIRDTVCVPHAPAQFSQMEIKLSGSPVDHNWLQHFRTTAGHIRAHSYECSAAKLQPHASTVFCFLPTQLSANNYVLTLRPIPLCVECPAVYSHPSYADIVCNIHAGRPFSRLRKAHRRCSL